MNIELKSISVKRFLIITLPSIPLILFLSIGLGVLIDSPWPIVLLMPSLLGLVIYLGQRYSKFETRVELSDEGSFRIDERVIKYNSVLGYYLDIMSPTQSALCLRLDSNETIQITSSSVGEQGKKFDEAKDLIIEQLRRKNEDLMILNYQDVYVRQTNILRPLIYATAGLVVILDIAFIYLIIFENVELPWKILSANVMLFWLIPLISKKNKTNLDRFENR